VKGLHGDEEDDDQESKTEGTVPNGDGDGDQDNDSVDGTGNGYYERDDAPVRGYGHAANAAQQRALAAVVEHYFRYGADEDGAAACSLLLPSLADSAVEDYGHGVGPPYLASAKSCSEIVVGMLRHAIGEVTGTIYVPAVRVGGERAYVLLGSTSAPARYAILERKRGGWKLSELLPQPLP
jgi:hypothetical protein